MKTVLLLLGLVIVLPVLAEESSPYFEIIEHPDEYAAQFDGATDSIPRASISSRTAAGDDWGYFPDDEDIMISPGSDHHSGASAVIVGRWRTAEGKRYLVLNSGQYSRIIPLRTRVEFDSFLNNLVPRVGSIFVCPLEDESRITCAESGPFMRLFVTPTTMTEATLVTLTWITNDYTACDISGPESNFSLSGSDLRKNFGSTEQWASSTFTASLTCYSFVTADMRTVTATGTLE